MLWTTWAGALRPIPVLIALSFGLGACGGGVGPARYGGGGYYGGGYGGRYGGGPGYYGSPYGGYGAGPYGGYNRSYGSRGYYGGGGGYGGSPRRENWSQDRLRQHWIDQSRRPR